MKKISIITVNYKSTRLINALEAKIRPGRAEFIVVDNSGDFVSVKKTTRVIKAGRNLGFGQACNLGVAHSDADIVVFMNPDLELSADDLAKLLDFSSCQSAEAIWGPFIRDGKGEVVSLFRSGRAGLAFRRRALNEADLAGVTVDVTYVSGACLATSRAFFQRLGGFIPDVFLYGEDLDLCLRAHDAGARVFLSSCIEVGHAGGGSSTLSDKYKRFFRGVKGHYTIFRKRRHSLFYALYNAIHLSTGRRI
jgi:N-acetylglucosaminyl-diphospho-decaprenol L-rhamnosyltransferase